MPIHSLIDLHLFPLSRKSFTGREEEGGCKNCFAAKNSSRLILLLFPALLAFGMGNELAEMIVTSKPLSLASLTGYKNHANHSPGRERQ
jgi:hypothetical protein